ncbi:hypothetical protein [Porphyromonas gingivalis]|uniref:hypothetical protein n=1 Tax=Porphyromonas gingivalis TaxID=837 RepID=UPI001E658336|nr:hypothetical protein [Porphyromonas gingivalis]
MQRSHANQSPDRILLGNNDIPPEYRAAVATQIELWPRLRNKLPQWAGISSLYIPSRLSLEQSSGAVTSSYKSRFIREGTKVVDLTGGLGIDFIALMSKASQGIYISSEMMKRLLQHGTTYRYYSTKGKM